MTELIIGADIGGTSTRVGVADGTGRFLAVACGGPANPNAVGRDAAIAEIRQVLTEALTRAAPQADPSATAARVVLGLAGISGLGDPEAFARATLPTNGPGSAAIGTDPSIAVVTDLEVAYASATPEPDGYCLIAGTGAMAGTIRAGVHVERRDGWGWLLGDDGSGFWLGREAVRSTLSQLETGRGVGPLAAAVLDRAGVEPTTDALIRASYAGAPRDLAGYAPLVTGLVDDDPAAAAIADRAAALLAATLDGLGPVPEQPIVLAGSVLTAGSDGRPSAVGSRLRARIGPRPDRPVFDAAAGVVGAVWLAIPAGSGPDRALHARLLQTVVRCSV